MDREYEANLDDERKVDLDDAAELTVPPPTIDPDERIEQEPEEDEALKDDRTVYPERPAQG